LSGTCQYVTGVDLDAVEEIIISRVKLTDLIDWRRRQMAQTIVDGFALLCYSRLEASGDGDQLTGGAALADEDEDVAQERRRVLRGSGRHDLLQLRNLSKVTGRHRKITENNADNNMVIPGGL